MCYEAVTNRDQFTGFFIEYVVVLGSVGVILNRSNALSCGTCISEEVFLTVDYLPQSLVEVRTVIQVSASACVGVPYVLGDLTGLFELIGNIYTVNIEGVCTNVSKSCCRIEVIPNVIDHIPAGYYFTELRIHILAGRSICQQTGVFGLTNVDTLCTEVIVEALYLDDTDQSFAVYVVSVTAILNDPTVSERLDQSISVLEDTVYILEVTALLGRQVGILEGKQTELFLILRLLREGIECACAEIYSIADLAAMYKSKLILCVPSRTVLRCKLDTAEHTERVSHGMVDSLSLVDPFQSKCKGVGGFIQFNALKLEILIYQCNV